MKRKPATTRRRGVGWLNGSRCRHARRQTPFGRQLGIRGHVPRIGIRRARTRRLGSHSADLLCASVDLLVKTRVEARKLRRCIGTITDRQTSSAKRRVQKSPAPSSHNRTCLLRNTYTTLVCWDRKNHGRMELTFQHISHVRDISRSSARKVNSVEVRTLGFNISIPEDLNSLTSHFDSDSTFIREPPKSQTKLRINNLQMG